MTMVEVTKYTGKFCLLFIFLSDFINLNGISEAAVSKRIINKRQASLEDIIQGALNFVRPIIDTAKPLQDDTVLSSQATSDRHVNRASEILGAPNQPHLTSFSICKGDSDICEFLSCSAKKFKNNEFFANLNLAAQVLSDKKLRTAISSNPETLQDVCYEQGLSSSQCKLFAKGFQFIDKVMTSIEPNEIEVHGESNQRTDEILSKTAEDAPPIPIPKINPEKSDNIIGSRTWSSRKSTPANIEMPKNQTPITPLFLPTFPPLIFTFPTFPTLFPTITPPSLFLKGITSPIEGTNLPPNLFSPIKPLLPFKYRKRRSTNVIQNIGKVNIAKYSGSAIGFNKEMESFDFLDDRWKRSADYYDNIDDNNSDKEMIQNDDAPKAVRVVEDNGNFSPVNGLIDCIQFLNVDKLI